MGVIVGECVASPFAKATKANILNYMGESGPPSGPNESYLAEIV